MNRPIEQTIRKFNPGTFQPDEEVIRQFVVRKCELEIVLEILRGNIDSPSCEHVLLVAPRGRGKTTLLARVASELRTDTELSGQLFPIRFMEESQEIFNLADFWLETLFYLARESTERDPDLSRELQDTHAGLAGEWRGENLEERARAAVLEAADRIGMKLVLMVENLQALCECVDDDFGWKLRGALQSEPQIMLLATATSRFKGLDDAREPFFELFRVLRLEPLDTDQCRCLWQMVTRDTVTDRDIRPLQILTGGNPRLLIIIADFARHRSLRELMEDLVSLIDDHTEYFRAHLEGFAKTERRVYLAAIDLWQPSTTGEIAARARMDVRAVSALLGRLVERGAMTVEGSGRKRMYAASERLYSIYYKLRRERDEAAVVRNLLHFMGVFYGGDELVEISGKLGQEVAQSPAIREGFERAMAELPQIGDAFYSIADPHIKQTSERTATITNRNTEQIVNTVTTAIDEGKFDDIVQIVTQFLASQNTYPRQIPDQLIAMLLLKKAFAYSELGNHEGVIAACDEIIECFEGRGALELQVQVAKALFNKGNALGQLGEPATAIMTYDDVIERFGNSEDPTIRIAAARALVNKGYWQGQRGEAEAAIATYDEAIRCFGESTAPELQIEIARALFSKGATLSRLGEAEAEIAAYDEVDERFGDSDEPELQIDVAKALVNKGIAQWGRGKAEAAIAICNKTFQRFGGSDAREIQVSVAMAMVNQGAIQIQIDRTEEALNTCDELERRFGTLTGNDEIAFEWWARWIRTKALLVQGRYPAAMDAFRSVYAAFDPGHKTMMREVLPRVFDLIATGVPERDLIQILSSDKEKSNRLGPLVVALRRRTGEEVRAPTEVFEVVVDILADIIKRVKAKEGTNETALPGATN